MAKLFDVKVLEEARQRLQLLKQEPPEPDERITKETVLQRLAPEIVELRRQGYSLAQIARALTNAEFRISRRTILQFLNKQNKATETKPRSRRKSTQQAQQPAAQTLPLENDGDYNTEV